MKKILPLLVAAAVAGGVVAYSMYNKPHKDYGAAEVAQTWTSHNLVSWYSSHPAEDHAQWQDKVVLVEGPVSSSSDQGVVLSPGVAVTWEVGKAPTGALEGTVQVKGRIVGFDDLFGEVRLDHAQVVD